MSHNYLLSLYCFIEAQKQTIRDTTNTSGSSSNQKCFDAGRLSVLTEFEAFLHTEMDHKLPRRLYRQLFSKDGTGPMKIKLSRAIDAQGL